MKNTLFNKKPVEERDETLKVTTLLYLEEALDQEQYEEVPAFIEAAKRYGAKRNDVRKIITRYVRKLQGVKPRAKEKTRRRF